MPRTSRNARSVRTMSATVITGKSDPYGRPVAGSIDDGPVVPRQPPSRLVETTKKRSVSKALPGPIIPSHQPSPLPRRAVPVLGREPVAGALGGRRRGDAGRVGVAAERVADEDDVVARGGQGAVGLVRHPDRVQVAPAVQPHRVRQVEVLRLDTADRPGGEPGQCHGRERSPRSAECIVSHPDRESETRRRGSDMTVTDNDKTAENGVNVQALLDAREVLKGAPEAAQFTWRASSTWKNGVHSTTTIQNFFGLGQEQQHKTEDGVRRRPPRGVRRRRTTASPRSSTCSSAWPAA